MKITNDIKYIGVDDYKIDLFEGQFKVPNGMSYNSYLILDEKIAILDSVDINFKDVWLTNIQNILEEREPDFLIIHHMEPDHSASIIYFMNKYPKAIIVSSSKAFSMMKNYFNTEFIDRRIIVDEGDNLLLGKHKLTFINAPMVHWPEVIFSYDEYDKVLFSSDAFGKFGVLAVEDDWISEARRYYFSIVVKYGLQVQSVLKKIANLEINIICSLHGPILNSNLNYYLNLYNIWSSYNYEEEGIVIAYTSSYGNTKEIVLLLKDKLLLNGIKNVEIYDLARCELSEAIASAFRYNKLILATTTYNAGIFPFMRTFINNLVERNYQNRIISLIENGSWAPVANKIMKEMFNNCKDIKFLNGVTIFSKLNENSLNQLNNLIKEL